MTDDKHVIACNVTEPTKTATAGSRAYVIWPNPGWANERIYLLIRSRGGRWIKKWEDMRRVDNFRAKTLPPEHPLYGRDLMRATDEGLQYLRRDCDHWHNRGGA